MYLFLTYTPNHLFTCYIRRNCFQTFHFESGNFSPFTVVLLQRHHLSIAFRAAIPEELPDITDLAYQVEIHIGRHHIVA